MYDTFSLVWWNTSLSPRAKKRSKQRNEEYEANRKIVVDCIGHMLNIGVDIIILCEVSAEDIGFLRYALELTDYAIHSGVRKVDNLQFDTCVIYAKKRIYWLNYSDEFLSTIHVREDGSNYKIAQQFSVFLPEDGSIFHIFASHWTSRLAPTRSQNAAHRINLARLLRHSVKRMLGDDWGQKSVILLGDYNDEPFDMNIFEHLKASPDKALVTQPRYAHLLYNPFWKCMTDAYYGKKIPSYCGTYFDKNGQITRWRTFDQIMVSQALLTSSLWQLDDEQTRVLFIPEYSKLVVKSGTTFDHMPIIAVLRKG